jgi:hypothetical protein
MHEYYLDPSKYLLIVLELLIREFALPFLIAARVLEEFSLRFVLLRYHFFYFFFLHSQPLNEICAQTGASCVLTFIRNFDEFALFSFNWLCCVALAEATARAVFTTFFSLIPFFFAPAIVCFLLCCFFLLFCFRF